MGTDSYILLVFLRRLDPAGQGVFRPAGSNLRRPEKYVLHDPLGRILFYPDQVSKKSFKF
jgi:hypothetical protein